MTTENLAAFYASLAFMRPGDVLAFSGRAPISFLIDAWTDSCLSHVAMVKALPFMSVAQASGWVNGDVYVTQSTLEKGVNGPDTQLLSKLLTVDYAKAGSCAWWLPLADGIRALIDWKKFNAFIAEAERVNPDGTKAIQYDVPGYFGFLLRDIPFLGSRLSQSETAKRMFCSAYDTAIFEACGVLHGIDFTSVAPRDLVRMKLYSKAVQILGPAKLVDARFNTL